ncbi:MAG: hypothetical protein ACR2N4_19280 [Jatrophihabitans sp.]
MLHQGLLHLRGVDVEAAADDHVLGPVDQVEKVSRYAELSKAEPTVTEQTAYALFDGLFQRAILHHLAGSDMALSDLSVAVLSTLPRLIS